VREKTRLTAVGVVILESCGQGLLGRMNNAKFVLAGTHVGLLRLTAQYMLIPSNRRLGTHKNEHDSLQGWGAHLHVADNKSRGGHKYLIYVLAHQFLS
jgi:hypothetical protein